MTKPKPSKRNLTAADRAAAARLKTAWEQRKRERRDGPNPLKQEEFAVKLGERLGKKAATTQSLISQYVNGGIALNYKALLAFCEELDWTPADIRNDLPEQQAESKDPIKNLRNDIKALRFAMISLVGNLSGKRSGEVSDVLSRLRAAIAEDKEFEDSGYLGSLLVILEEGSKKKAKAFSRTLPGAASAKPKHKQADV